ncbi:MAG TPA: nitronate monooxygenase family protein [Acidimicrobiales bacterium]|nr:nitronate monooxygenase family protein [Acidimicrobiales bacterium]
MKSELCEMLGIEFPIFAFTHCRDVAAAVSRAGGMGVLGALAFSPEQLEIELSWIDEHCGGKPYGVDVVMPVKSADREAGLHDEKQLAQQLRGMISQAHWDYVEKILADHGVPPLSEEPDAGSSAGDPLSSGVLGWTEATGTPLIDVALAHPISLLASALGPPPKEAIDRAHEQGVQVAALIGRVEQAVRDVQKGVDIIIAQGYEAGGHTGEVASMVLVPDVVDAVAPVPVLAAGGIATGRQMAAAMALGAQGVWTGSIWLTVSEANTGEIAMDKLLAASSTDTVRSRALTGKPARQLRTAWTEAWEAPESPGTLPMPLQFILNNYAMRRIQRSNNRELTGMPVGQVVSRMNKVRPSKDVIYDMVEEYIDTMTRLAQETTTA